VYPLHNVHAVMLNDSIYAAQPRLHKQIAAEEKGRGDKFVRDLRSSPFPLLGPRSGMPRKAQHTRTRG
jgi:hypothetical protein